MPQSEGIHLKVKRLDGEPVVIVYDHLTRLFGLSLEGGRDFLEMLRTAVEQVENELTIFWAVRTRRKGPEHLLPLTDLTALCGLEMPENGWATARRVVRQVEPAGICRKCLRQVKGGS